MDLSFIVFFGPISLYGMFHGREVHGDALVEIW